MKTDFFDMPITQRLTIGSDSSGGIVDYRNRGADVKPSLGRLFMTEAMLVGTFLVSLVEIVSRVAFAALAFIPLMFTVSTQKEWGKHFAKPLHETVYWAAGLPMLMVDNVMAVFRKNKDMGEFFNSIN